jgi:hypothetical protein
MNMAKKLIKIQKPIGALNIFAKFFKIFESNIALHRVSIDTIGSYALRYDKSVIEKVTKKINSNLKNRIKGKSQKITITDEEVDLIIEARKKHPKQGELFAKNTLVSIVSTLDILFARIFEFYYTNNPSKLSLDNKNITFSELKSIKKVEEAQKFLINREVDLLLLQKGIKERFDILKDELGIIIPDNAEYIKELKKLVKMRNLIVHNEGRADGDFVSHYGEGKLKEDEFLKVEQEYLKDAVELVYFVGSYILQIAQKNLSKNPILTSDYIINDVMHDLLQKDQYNLMRPIYDYAIIEGNLDDINKKMIIVNYCIALKKQGKANDHIEKVLDKEDWTSSREDFKMAHSALKGNREEFYRQLANLIKTKKVFKDQLEDWQLFTFYRKDPKFKELLKIAPKQNM